MQESEKVEGQPTAWPLVFSGGRLVKSQQTAVVKAALILFVPFWIESVHELLKRIA